MYTKDVKILIKAKHWSINHMSRALCTSVFTYITFEIITCPVNYHFNTLHILI